MTEPRLDRLRALGAQYLTDRETARQRAEAARRDHERNAMTGAAATVLARDFPATLGRILDRADFTGYPRASDTDPRHLACALAYLGHGVWLHYTSNRFAIVHRCRCGTYREHHLTNDTQFATALNDGFDTERPCPHTW